MSIAFAQRDRVHMSCFWITNGVAARTQRCGLPHCVFRHRCDRVAWRDKTRERWCHGGRYSTSHCPPLPPLRRGGRAESTRAPRYWVLRREPTRRCYFHRQKTRKTKARTRTVGVQRALLLLKRCHQQRLSSSAKIRECSPLLSGPLRSPCLPWFLDFYRISRTEMVRRKGTVDRIWGRAMKCVYFLVY